MDRDVNLARAGLAGLVWGTVFGVPSITRSLLNGDRYPIHAGPLDWALGLISVLVFTPIGSVLALPYAAFLGAWEARVRPNARLFLAGSLLWSALCAAVPAVWYARTSQEFYPNSGFTGPQRMACAAFAAALTAGYMVGRYLPQTGDNPARRAYRKYSLLLWLGIVLGVYFLLALVLFPVFGGAR